MTEISSSGLLASLLRILSVCVTVLPPLMGESMTVMVVLFLGATVPPPEEESGADKPVLLTSSGPLPIFFTFKCSDLVWPALAFRVIGFLDTLILPPGLSVGVEVGVSVPVAVAVAVAAVAVLVTVGVEV